MIPNHILMDDFPPGSLYLIRLIPHDLLSSCEGLFLRDTRKLGYMFQPVEISTQKADEEYYRESTLEFSSFKPFRAALLLRLHKGSQSETVHRGDIMAAIRETGPWESGVETALGWLMGVTKALMKVRSDIFHNAEDMMKVKTEYLALNEGYSKKHTFIFLNVLPNLSIRLADSVLCLKPQENKAEL
jgi:hypothetical protein